MFFFFFHLTFTVQLLENYITVFIFIYLIHLAEMLDYYERLFMNSE